MDTVFSSFFNRNQIYLISFLNAESLWETDHPKLEDPDRRKFVDTNHRKFEDPDHPKLKIPNHIKY